MEIGAMKRKAFTLVEILIVVVILAILAAVVVPMFTDASVDAMESSLKTNLSSMRSQLAVYHAQHKSTYPATLGLLAVETDINGTNPVPNGSRALGPYIQGGALPVNPFTQTNDVGAAGAGTAWTYDSSAGTVIANDGGLSPEGVAHSSY